MKIFFILVLTPIIVFFSCNKGKNDEDSCNGESTRRSVKLVTDDAALEVDTNPIVISVDSFGSIVVPEADRNTERQEFEKKVFQVTAKVDKVKKHRDGDYKVKLVSDNEKYLNCEIPNPDCEYAAGSRFYKEFVEVRAFMDEHYKDLEGKTVTIVGVGFLDIDHHYPRNAAENEVELHPVLHIEFE